MRSRILFTGNHLPLISFWDQLEAGTEIIKRHSGNAPVLLYVEGGKALKAGRELWVDPEGQLISELEQLVGMGNVKKEKTDTEAL